jgi:hypothetical protein
MKKYSKIFGYLMIAALLTACQSLATPAPSSAESPTALPMPTAAPIPTLAPAPTSAPEEVLATSGKQIYGIYFNATAGGEAGGLFLDLSGLKTIDVYTGMNSLGDSAKFSFDAGKITYAPGKLCNDPATYEVYLIMLDGKLTGIRHKLVGDGDVCLVRKDSLDGLQYQLIKAYNK